MQECQSTNNPDDITMSGRPAIVDSNDMSKLKNKVAIVTGASKGIGASIDSDDAGWVTGEMILGSGGMR